MGSARTLTEINHVAKFLLRRVSHLHGLFSHDTIHLNISLRKKIFILIVEDIIWVLEQEADTSMLSGPSRSWARGGNTCKAKVGGNLSRIDKPPTTPKSPTMQSRKGIHTGVCNIGQRLRNESEQLSGLHQVSSFFNPRASELAETVGKSKNASTAHPSFQGSFEVALACFSRPSFRNHRIMCHKAKMIHFL